jgi:hypothetical protein
MATPNITLTCTLQDINGNAVQQGTVTIVLFGFGAVLPMIEGTSMLAKVGPIAYSLADGTFDTGLLLWGNDQITPLNQTFYCITIEDNKKNIVQSGIYQFTGTQTIDLSNAQQVAPGIGVPPLQFVTADIWIILPGLTQQQKADINDLIVKLTELGFVKPTRPKPMPPIASMPTGYKALSAPPGNVYTLTRQPYNGQIIGLFYNGTLLLNPLHYSLSGQTITLTFDTAIGDNLCASYVATSLN